MSKVFSHTTVISFFLLSPILIVTFSCTKKKEDRSETVLDITASPVSGENGKLIEYKPNSNPCKSCRLDEIDSSATLLKSFGQRGAYRGLALGMSLTEAAVWAQDNQFKFLNISGNGFRRTLNTSSKLECIETSLRTCEAAFDTSGADFPVDHINATFYKGYVIEIEVVFSKALTRSSRLSFLKASIDQLGSPTFYYRFLPGNPYVIGDPGKAEWVNDDVNDAKYCTVNQPPKSKFISKLRWQAEGLIIDLMDIQSFTFPGQESNCDKYDDSISAPYLIMYSSSLNALIERAKKDSDSAKINNPF